MKLQPNKSLEAISHPLEASAMTLCFKSVNPDKSDISEEEIRKATRRVVIIHAMVVVLLFLAIMFIILIFGGMFKDS